MIEDPDKELVTKAQAGDKAAFGTLVNRYYEMVYAVAYGVLNNHELARDACQEVFIKAYKEIVRFEGKSKFKTWLYRVSMNASIDSHRKKHPMESIDATDVSDEEDKAPMIIVDDAPGPREMAWRAELSDLWKDALEQISADHRAVLLLREWDGLSYDEIAEILKVEVGTVMSRLFYARKKMAEILGPKLGRKPNAERK